jgi:hypothetical protein
MKKKINVCTREDKMQEKMVSFLTDKRASTRLHSI